MPTRTRTRTALDEQADEYLAAAGYSVADPDDLHDEAGGPSYDEVEPDGYTTSAPWSGVAESYGAVPAWARPGTWATKERDRRPYPPKESGPPDDWVAVAQAAANHAQYTARLLDSAALILSLLAMYDANTEQESAPWGRADVAADLTELRAALKRAIARLSEVEVAVHVYQQSARLQVPERARLSSKKPAKKPPAKPSSAKKSPKKKPQGATRAAAR